MSLDCRSKGMDRLLMAIARHLSLVPPSWPRSANGADSESMRFECKKCGPGASIIQGVFNVSWGIHGMLFRGLEKRYMARIVYDIRVHRQ